MDAKHFSHPHEIGQRFRTKLVHQPVAMHLYGDFAYAHLRRCLLVKQARNHKRHYPAFTFGKSFKPGLQVAQILILSSLNAVALERRPDRVLQILLTKRFS